MSSKKTGSDLFNSQKYCDIPRLDIEINNLYKRIDYFKQ